MASPAYSSILLLYTYFACLAWNFSVILLSNLYHIENTLYLSEISPRIFHTITNSKNNEGLLFSRKKEISSSGVLPCASSGLENYSSFYYDFYHFWSEYSR
jgi:hypothetical protein